MALLGDHMRVKAVSFRSRLFLGALLGLVLVGCGPTANAIRPTLPPRTIRPVPTAAPATGGSEPTAPGGSLAPVESQTPQPAGIAQPMASFPQGAAYEVNSVTATPTGYVAVGFQGTGQGYYGLPQGVVWTSSDGSTWQQTIDAAFVDVSPNQVLAMGDDVYVFGDYSSCLEENCPLDPSEGTVIFKSASGGPWQQLAQTTDIIKAEFSGVRVWGSTLVAWGAAGDDNGTTTVWTSTDGLTWTPTTDLAGLDPVDTLGSAGPGLVALGSQTVESTGDYELIAASSSDGVHFGKTNAPSIASSTMVDVTSGPGGMAAIGYIESETTSNLGLALFSADGSNWSQANPGEGSFDNTSLDDIHATSNAYVTVGSTLDEDFNETGNVWISADGQSWRSLGAFGGVFTVYGDSALGPGGLVVFTATEGYSNDVDADIKSTINGWLIPTAQLTP